MDVHGTKPGRTIRSELSKDAASELRERGFVVIRGSFSSERTERLAIARLCRLAASQLHPDD